MQGAALVTRGANALALLLVSTVVAAACSTSPPLACPAAASCPSLDGATSFCSWSEWGCAPEKSCSGYFVLIDEGIDARLTYYYSAATGQYVATVSEPPGGGSTSCIAGPSSFQPPSGCDVDTLADCGPPPRDGGTSASDAASDAPYNPPSPSGSPSTQPLALPPHFPPYPPR
jgi:hypothetical protein